jgi:hypothetical protein
MHALGQLPDLDQATALVAVHDPVEPDPEDAALYRRLRPLVEQSTLALADVFAALDAHAPAMAGATSDPDWRSRERRGGTGLVGGRAAAHRRVGVLVLLFLIMKVKLHAFLALVLVSLGVALATRIPLAEVVPTLTMGFGTTLASVALLVGLGAMLGRLLEFSGGAQVLADSLVRRLRRAAGAARARRRRPAVRLPDLLRRRAGRVPPIVFTVALRLGGSLLSYGLPVAGAFAVMHAFVPPHPGPVAAAELVGADISLVPALRPASRPADLVRRRLPVRHLGRPPVPRRRPGPAVHRRRHGRRTRPCDTGWRLLPARRRRRGRRGHAGHRRRRHGPRSRGALGRRACGAGDGRPPDVRHRPRPAAPAARAHLPQHRHEHPRHGGCRQRGVAGRAARAAHRRDARRAAHHGPRRVVRARHPPRDGQRRGRVDREQRVGAGLRDHPHHRRRRHVRRCASEPAASARPRDVLEDIGLPVIVAGLRHLVLLRVAQGSATVALTTGGRAHRPVVEATTACRGPTSPHRHRDRRRRDRPVARQRLGFWLVSRFFQMDEATTFKTWTVMETLLGTIGLRPRPAAQPRSCDRPWRQP